MRCANSECHEESQYLRGGALYWVDSDPESGGVTKGRFIWLCARCVEEFVIERWRPPGQQLRRRWSTAPVLRGNDRNRSSRSLAENCQAPAPGTEVIAVDSARVKLQMRQRKLAG